MTTETVLKVGASRYGTFKHFVVVDLETRRPDGVHIADEGIAHGDVDVGLHLGVAVHVDRTRNNAENWVVFNEPAELWDWMDGLFVTGTRLAVFAHNMGHDSAFIDIDGEPPKRGWEWSKNPMTKPVFIVTLENPNKDYQIKLLCSSANLPTGGSVEKIGDDLEIPKLTMPADDAPEEEWIEYCKRDVEVVKEFLLRYMDMLDRNSMGDQQYTLASQASWSWQQGLRDWPFSERPCKHDNDELRDMERAAIHGPRIEAFWTGRYNGLSYQLDAVSLYASVMSGNLFSMKLYKGIKERPAIAEVEGALAFGAGMLAEVWLDTQFPHYPAPGQAGDGVVFPIGEFKTTLATPELTFALQHGHVKEVVRAQAYQRGEVFTEFVDKIWGMIQHEEPQNVRLLKQMLRSLWGRLAARYQKWQPAPEYADEVVPPYGTTWDVFDASTKTFTQLRSNGREIEKRGSHDWEWGPASMPMLAAEVISYARLRMLKLMHAAGNENVFYISTDSLIMNADGFLRLGARGEVGDELGKMRLEETGNQLEIWRPHAYTTPEGTTKISGVRTDDFIEEVDGERLYRSYEFPRYGGQARVVEHRIRLPKQTGRYKPESRTRLDW